MEADYARLEEVDAEADADTGLARDAGQGEAEDERASRASAEADECRICGDTAFTKRNNLISPCQCTGSISKVHVECLEKWILNRPGNRAAGDNLDCEICHSAYTVSLRHRLKLNAETLCTCSSMAHAAEALLLMIAVGCLVAVITSGLSRLAKQHARLRGVPALGVLGVLVAVMTLVAARRLFIRWHRTTSTPRVALNV